MNMLYCRGFVWTHGESVFLLTGLPRPVGARNDSRSSFSVIAREHSDRGNFCIDFLFLRFYHNKRPFKRRWIMLKNKVLTPEIVESIDNTNQIDERIKAG